MESISRFITQKLKLKVNEAKSAVARPQERKFLGFSFTAGPDIKRTIAPKSLERFKQRKSGTLREGPRAWEGRSCEAPPYPDLCDPKAKCRPRRAMSEIGGKGEDICSLRVFAVWTHRGSHIVALHCSQAYRGVQQPISRSCARHLRLRQQCALSFIVFPLPPRRAAVAGSRAYRKWRGAAPLRGR
jgi:hypothetical protein